MKFLAVALLLITTIVAFLIASFSGEIQSQIVQGLVYLLKLSEANVNAPLPRQNSISAPAAAQPAGQASSSGFKPPGFVGPSGPPRIIGPKGNPPNY